MKSLLGAWVIPILLLAIASTPVFAEDNTLKLEPYVLRTFDGQEHSAERGRLMVRENRLSSSLRLTEVGFVRLRHTGLEAGTPIVFLPPGPGIPGTTLGRVPVYFRLFSQLQAMGDVILLDVRGEGLSVPNLDDCPIQESISPRTFATSESLVQQTAASVAHCAAFWRSRVDLSAYNNREIAEDVEELRRALGYEKISLLGFSAGTDLAMEILRKHGGSVESAVLASTGAAEVRPNLPFTYDLQLRKVSSQYQSEGESRPDLVALFDEGVAALDKTPVTLQLAEGKDKRQVSVRVGSIALKAIVTDLLNGSVGMVPALLTSIHDRDYSLLQIFVQKMFTGLHGSMTLVGRTIDCSAALPVDRIARVAAEARLSRFGNARNLHFEPAVCEAAIGRQATARRDRLPLFSSVPTLFISGSLDANTPPFNAQTLLWGFPRGIHVVVENGFHETLPAPEVQAAVIEFLSKKSISLPNIIFKRPEFLSLESARNAAQRSR
jgi:pimeloyl-ACP methyl ester carboxylesterase